MQSSKLSRFRKHLVANSSRFGLFASRIIWQYFGFAHLHPRVFRARFTVEQLTRILNLWRICRVKSAAVVSGSCLICWSMNWTCASFKSLTCGRFERTSRQLPVRRYRARNLQIDTVETCTASSSRSRLCTSLCDLPSLISLTIFSRKCRGIRPRRTAAIAKTIWRSFQKAFKNFPAICFQKFSSDLLSKIFQRFAFKKLSNFFQRFAFKNFPAICFQKFASDLLSKICQLFSFQKAFKNFPAICFQKAFKNFPAISFQHFSSDLLSNFWTLRDRENLKAHCFQNFVNEN